MSEQAERSERDEAGTDDGAAPEPALFAWVMDADDGEPLDAPIPYALAEVRP